MPGQETCPPLKHAWGTNEKLLMQVWHFAYRHPVLAARTWFPRRRKGYVRAAMDLGNYASNRAAALSCRREKKHSSHRMYNRIANGILQRLIRGGWLGSHNWKPQTKR